MAGLASTRVDRRCAAAVVLHDHRPDLTLVYLPHLDYDPQRFGPTGSDMAEVREGTRRRLRAAARRGEASSGRGSGW